MPSRARTTSPWTGELEPQVRIAGSAAVLSGEPLAALPRPLPYFKGMPRKESFAGGGGGVATRPWGSGGMR